MIFADATENFDTSYSLVEYQPYWIDRANQEKNSKFDRDSRLILDIKENKPSAVEHFFGILDSILGEGFPIAIVPSSDPEKIDSGIRQIAIKLAANSRIDATSCLVRHMKINKLSHGGDRSIEVHLNSIKVINTDIIRARKVLLLDDVMTSGNSLIACQKLLQKAGAFKVLRLALAQTAKKD